MVTNLIRNNTQEILIIKQSDKRDQHDNKSNSSDSCHEPDYCNANHAFLIVLNQYLLCIFKQTKQAWNIDIILVTLLIEN